MAPPKTDVAAVAGGILENALNAAQFAAQFTPIPALGPALAALGAIVQACNNITSNKCVSFGLFHPLLNNIPQRQKFGSWTS